MWECCENAAPRLQSDNRANLDKKKQQHITSQQQQYVTTRRTTQQDTATLYCTTVASGRTRGSHRE